MDLVKARSVRPIMLVAIFAILLRIAIDISLIHHGYFLGEAMDSFLRTERSWLWSQAPFLTTGPPMWPPLQYALAGILFWLVSPFNPGSTLAIPIILNHFAFVGSIALLYLSIRKLAGPIPALIGCAIASMMTYDVWMTFSAQVEPILTFLALVLAYLLIDHVDNPRSSRLAAIGAVVFLLDATHYSGWFIGLAGITFLIVEGRAALHTQPQNRRWIVQAFLGLVLATAFPLLWMIGQLLRFGDPFAFLKWTESTHAIFLSGMPLWERLFSVPLAAFDAAPLISVAALPAIVIAVRSNRKAALFLSPFAPQLLLLTLANVLSLGPTRYIPRVTLPMLWAILAAVAVAAHSILRSRTRVWQWIAIVMALGLGLYSYARTLHFNNRITMTLRDTASLIAREFTDPQIDVYAQYLSWLDGDALAVLTQAPNRIHFVPDAVFSDVASSASDSTHLLLFSDPRMMEALTVKGKLLLANSDYLLIQPVPHSSRVLPLSIESSSWSSESDDTFAVQLPDQTIAFGFKDLPGRKGQVAEVHSDISVVEHGCYLLDFGIRDFSSAIDKDWQYLHQVVANGIVIWSYDPTADSFDGWQSVSEYFMPSTDKVRLSFQVLALSPPDPYFDWKHAGEIAVRSLSLESCD